MSDKFPVLLGYALFGLLIGLTPTVWPAPPSPSPAGAARSRDRLGIVLACLAVGAAALLVPRSAARPSILLAFLPLALLAGLRRGKPNFADAAGALAGLAVAATLPWWRRPAEAGALDVSPAELLVFALLTGAAFWALTSESAPRRTPLRLLAASFALLAAILSFTTGIFHTPAFITGWHHWGAYIGPAELLRTGARIFRDFPAQYGLGPTAVIAAACGRGCWTGMYWVVGFSTLGFALVIAALAIEFGPKSTLARAAILAIALLCCFIWNSYPAGASDASITPSVGGLRFLPAVALTALLVFGERGRATHWAYLSYAICVLWSPEALFCGTFVFWPWVLWTRCAGRERPMPAALVRASGTLLLSLLAPALGFFAVYFLVYRAAPTAYGFFAYLVNPPGPMPINPRGTIWFFAAVLALGLLALWSLRRMPGEGFRRLFPAVLLAYSTFSYYLGRSHDNNLLNLLPMLFLVLLGAATAPLPGPARAAASMLAASLLGWSSLFGWSLWQQTAQEHRLVEFNAGSVRALWSFENADTDAKVYAHLRGSSLDAGDPKDAGRAVAFIRGQRHEPVTVLDYSLDLVITSDGAAWSAIHGPANFPYIPPGRRREFIAATARTLGRSGWLVIDRKYPYGDLMQDFETAYKRTEEIDFGSYLAIRYAPR